MENKEYPLMPKSKRANCKLTEDDIDDMKKMSVTGFSRHEIAEKFNVTKETVLYWTNENVRERHLKRSSEHGRDWRKKEPEKYKQSARKAYHKKMQLQKKEVYEYKMSLVPKDKLLARIKKYEAKISELKSIINKKQL